METTKIDMFVELVELLSHVQSLVIRTEEARYKLRHMNIDSNSRTAAVSAEGNA